MRLLLIFLIVPILHSCTASDQEVRHDLYSMEILMRLSQYGDAKKIAQSVKARDPHYDQAQVWLDIIAIFEANPEKFGFDNSARIQDAFYRQKFAEAGVPYP